MRQFHRDGGDYGVSEYLGLNDASILVTPAQFSPRNLLKLIVIVYANVTTVE